MASPTTNWGSTGNPLYATTLQNPLADVYTATPGVTATTPNSTDGPPLGQAQTMPDGTIFQFLMATGSIAANAACMTSGVWQNTWGVAQTSGINKLVVAVNDRSGVALTVGEWTFFTTKGLAFPLTAASVAAGAIVAASGTAGVLYAATAGTDLQGTMVNTVVVGGSQAKSPVLMI